MSTPREGRREGSRRRGERSRESSHTGRERVKIRKKKTCWHKTLRWTKVVTMLLAFFGLLVMFYLLGVIIIDDVSPLEAFTFTRKEKEEDSNFSISSNNTHATHNNTINSVKVHGTNASTNASIDAEGRSYVAYVPVPLNNDEHHEKKEEKSAPKSRVHEKSLQVPKGINRKVPYFEPKSRSAANYPTRRTIKPRFRRPQQSIRRKNPKYITRRRHLAPVARRKVRIPYNARTFVKERKPSVERISHSDPDNEYHSDYISDDMIMKRHWNPHKSEDFEGSPSILTSIYNLMRNPASLFSSKEDHPREEMGRTRLTEYPRTFRRPSRRLRSRLQSSRYPKRVLSSRYRRPHKKTYRRYRLPRTPHQKPPQDYRYPSTAENIQDIIEYMSSKEVTDHFRKKTLQNKRRKKNSKDMNGYIVGNQDHIIGPNIYTQTHDNQKYQIYDEYLDSDKIELSDDMNFDIIEEEEIIPEEYEYDFGDILKTKNKYNFPETEHDQHDTMHASIPGDQITLNRKKHHNRLPITDENAHFPTNDGVRNTFAFTKQHSAKPFSIVMDVYPKEDRQRQTPKPYETYFSLGDQQNVHIDNHRNPEGSSRHSQADNNKHQILLHINLYSRKPTQSRVSPSTFKDEDMALSLDLPIMGSMSPLDIYRAVISQARSNPRAFAQTKEKGDKSDKKRDETFGIELFDVEDGPQLYLAIEQGLRELNPALPEDLRFLLPEEPLSLEKLYEIDGKGMRKS